MDYIQYTNYYDKNYITEFERFYMIPRVAYSQIAMFLLNEKLCEKVDHVLGCLYMYYNT